MLRLASTPEPVRKELLRVMDKNQGLPPAPPSETVAPK